MRNTFILTILVSVMTLTSCSDKVALAYAEDLLTMLDSLILQSGKKLADEQKRYIAEARDFEEFKDVDALSSLTMARTTASTTTVLNQLVDGKTTASQVLSALIADYAEVDFSTTQRIYEKRADAHLASLANLQNLSLDQAKLKALRNAVEALTRRPSLVAQSGQYVQFAKELKTNLDFHACETFTTTMSELDADIKALDGLIAAAGTNATEVSRLNALKAAAQANRKIAETRRNGTGRFAGGKCSRS